MADTETDFRTPDLYGKAFMRGERWQTTTCLPTVRVARIIDPPSYLRPGLSIRFDLLTRLGESGNTYLAENVQKLERFNKQKLKPKQKDKIRKRKT